MSESCYELRLKNGNTLVLVDAVGIIKWVEAERKSWAWVDEHSKLTTEVKAYLDILMNRLLKPAQTFVSTSGSPQSKQNLDVVLSKMQAAIDNETYLPGDTALSAYARDISVTYPELSANILKAAMMPYPQSNQLTRPYLEGIAALSAFKLGTAKKGATSTRRLLDQLSERYLADISELKVASESRLNELDKAIVGREEKVKRSTSGLARMLAKTKSNTREEQLELRTSAKDELDRLLSGSVKRIGEFEEFYETKIALATPIRYWKNKRYWHRISTVIFGGTFLSSAGFLVFEVNSYVQSFDGGFEAFMESWNSAELGALGIVAIMVGLSLVFSRIIYRLFASQLHLWNDASERITMTETYLALAEKGHNKDEFMGALVDRLFAPASDGVVKDDFGSISPLDALSRKLGS